MRKIMKSMLLLGCICSSTALGAQMAMADEAAPVAGQGQHQGAFGQQRRHHSFRRLARQLGLSGQQKAEAKAMFQGNRAAMKPLFVNLITAKHQLKTLVDSGSADAAAIKAQAAVLATAEANLAVQKSQNAKQFLALLTPEQVTAYQTIKAKRESRFQAFLCRMNAPAQAD
jgi:Spy/CpxP family protein refolding chaperone